MPTALFSVYDKKGMLPLAEGLKALGWDLLATGGTLKALREAGVEAREVADFTGAPECFGGRVKTLHPRIHGGLLFRRDAPDHAADAARLGIDPIDLVVVNLYPFEATVARPGATPEECVEQIDIGGPSMLRSAAKNHASVTVLTDPAQYPGFLAKLIEGTWSLEDRRACALAAFQRTAAYDAAISAWMAGRRGPRGRSPARAPEPRPRGRPSLRYGENPHQVAGLLRAPRGPGGGHLRLPPAPGQGAELQQPAGRGRRGPLGVPVQGALRGHRQAQQPLRGRPGLPRAGGLPQGPGRGPGRRLRRASSPSTARWGWKWPRPWSRPSGR